MCPTGGGPERRRTRLTPEREAELYGVVLEMLGEVGYEALALPTVASRSRSSTATIYRQWGGKPGLVLAALQHAQAPPKMLTVDTGSLRDDLIEMASRIHALTPAQHRLMAGLAHAALSDPELGAALRDQFMATGKAAIDGILTRAADRGEFPPDSPAREFCAYLLVTVGLLPRMMEGREPDARFIGSFVDSVIIPSLRHIPA
jgi:AcrR family transcriptional regulator